VKRVRIQFFDQVQLAVAGTLSIAFQDGSSMPIRGRPTVDEHGVLVEHEDNLQFAPWSSVRSLSFQRAGRFAMAEEANREAEEAALREEAAKAERAQKRKRREEARMEREPSPVVVELQPVRRPRPQSSPPRRTS
jgi:hypothetical protein